MEASPGNKEARGSLGDHEVGLEELPLDVQGVQPTCL